MESGSDGGEGSEEQPEQTGYVVPPDPADPTDPWEGRVRFSEGGGGPFAYRPQEVITTRGEEALAIAQELFGDGVYAEADLGPFTLLAGVPDPVRLIEELRLRGIVAQPNHVYFSHCGGCCPPHPAFRCGSWGANPAYPTPAYPTPAYPTPAYPTPAYPTPAYPTPAYPTPAYPTPAYPTPAYPTPRRSSARPAPPSAPVGDLTARYAMSAEMGVDGPEVIVLDTGLAGSLYPDALTPAPVQAASSSDVDEPDNPPDGFLDPAAGHGTFIAGLIQQVAPGCSVTVHGVIEPTGPVDEWAVINRIAQLVPDATPQTILSLSFGGYTLDQPVAFAWAIREIQATGAVVVASAGNDGSCRPAFPAALPDVVSVGAVGPAGPAPFTNYGPWVRACAPGVDLLSTFFQGWDGNLLTGPDGIDPDAFEGWAIWSGTSFSAPVVAGALVRIMTAEGIPAQAAVKRVIDHPSLMRIPDLGTVVNVI